MDRDETVVVAMKVSDKNPDPPDRLLLMCGGVIRNL